MPRTSLPGSLEREILGLRLEQAVYALQQILPLAVAQGDLESEAFLYELLRNYQLLQIELNRPESSTHYTNIAVYTFESPKNGLFQITNLLFVCQIVLNSFTTFPSIYSHKFSVNYGNKFVFSNLFSKPQCSGSCPQGLCKRPM